MHKVNTKLVLEFSLCAVTARKSLDFTQEDAAAMLDISVRCLQLIEKASRPPKFEVALQMSKLYGFDLNIFLDTVQLSEAQRPKKKN